MPVIDRPTFEQLKQISGREFINELIDAFLEDAPQMIQNLRSAVEARDAESFRRNAHSLKSNAHTFGATELGALARELEIMGRANDLEVGDRLEILHESFSRAAEELKGLRV